MDLVAKKDAVFFSDLQDFAKACADNGNLRVVFIFSDGNALPLLLSLGGGQGLRVALLKRGRLLRGDALGGRRARPH
jgi:hypothetical protein